MSTAPEDSAQAHPPPLMAELSNQPFWRTKAHPLWLGGCLFVASLIVFTWMSWTTSYEQRIRSQIDLLRITHSALDNYLAGLESGMDLLGSLVLEKGCTEATREALRDFRARHSPLTLVNVTSVQGKVTCSSDFAPGQTMPDIGREPTFIEAREQLISSRSLVLSRPFWGPAVKDWVAVARLLVSDEKGKPAFILSVGIPVEKQLNFWRDLPLPANTALGLRRDDGYIIARSTTRIVAGQKSQYDKPTGGSFQQHLKTRNFPTSGLFVGPADTREGQMTNYIYKRVEPYGLTLYLRTDQFQYTRLWWADVWQVYVLVLMLAAGLTLIYIWSIRRESRWQTERGKQLEDLQLANGELEAFAYTVSHDLRSPIRGINGYAHLVADTAGTRLQAQEHVYLQRILDSTARMSRMIDGLLAFSRLSRRELHKGDVNMNALVTEVIRSHHFNPDSVRFEVTALPPCQGHGETLHQVWSNLITNAVKFSRDARPAVIRIGHEESAYFVQDNGIGFDMAHRDKLFGVFTRLHHLTDFDGNGVGLAIVRRIVERHGGKVWASAKPGEGARFSFTLPA